MGADLDGVFERLQGSAFRRRFRLSPKDRAYLQARGLEAVLDHGRDFLRQRLAPAQPPHDGKQTPYRGHPVFTAQHATATCCRTCLAKWHGVPASAPMSEAEQAQALAVIRRWLEAEMARGAAPPDDRQPRLL